MPEATENAFLTKRELAQLCRCSKRTMIDSSSRATHRR